MKKQKCLSLLESEFQRFKILCKKKLTTVSKEVSLLIRKELENEKEVNKFMNIKIRRLINEKQKIQSSQYD